MEPPVIVCKGSHREIGLAHGQNAREKIHRAIEVYGKLYREIASITWAEARVRNQPFKSTIQRLAPYLFKEIQGKAEGADLDFDDILTLNIRSEISLTNYSDGCTAVAKVDVPNVLLAQNWDWIEEAGDIIVILGIQANEKPRIILSGEAGIVGKLGMNHAGVGVCMNAFKCGVVDSGKLPVHFAARMILESRSCGGAKSMMNRIGLASCINFMIADQMGQYAAIECTPYGNAVIEPVPGSGTVCHSNYLCSPAIPAGVKDFPSANSFSRLNRMQELSAGQDGSVEVIRSWLSDKQGAPTSICRSRPPGAKGIERIVKLATIIMDLTKLEMQASYGKPSNRPPVKVFTL